MIHKEEAKQLLMGPRLDSYGNFRQGDAIAHALLALVEVIEELPFLHAILRAGEEGEE